MLVGGIAVTVHVFLAPRPGLGQADSTSLRRSTEKRDLSSQASSPRRKKSYRSFSRRLCAAAAAVVVVVVSRKYLQGNTVTSARK